MKNLPAHSVGRSGQLCFQLLIVAFALVVGVCSKDVGARDLRSTDSSSTKSDRPAFAQGDTLVNDRCVPFPSAYAIQQTGNLDAHFDSYGRFGLAWGGYLPNGIWPEASFQTPSEYDIEYLFAGSFWIGGRIGNDTLVSAGIDGWQVAQEMWPPMSNGTYTNNIRPFSSIADRSYWSETTDTGLTGQYPMDVVLNRLHRPFPISIVNRSHVWRTDRTKDIIVYDMLLRNEGSSIIEDGYLGFYFDADAGHLTTSGYYSDDLSGSIRSDGIAYIIDNDGDPVGGQFVETTSPTKTFAFKLLESSVPLADTSFHWWLSNANSQDDFGPTRVDSLGNPIHCDFPTGGSGTPDGDLSKYCLLSSGEWDYDMIYVGREDEQDSLWMAPPPGLNLNWLDAKFLISFGPFTLPPDSVIRFVFSTFSADSVHVDPYNLSRLSVHPDSFKAYLNFDNMISNANVADSLAQMILDPLAAPSGLRFRDGLSTASCNPEIEWDPHVFPGVEGYEIYAWEITDDAIPYPGVIPPWLEAPALELWEETGDVSTYEFTSMDCSSSYIVNIAAISGGAIGAPSTQLLFDRTYRPEAPAILNSVGGKIFVEQGQAPHLVWNMPSYPVDHFNIYRIVNSEPSPGHYYPYYDRGCSSSRTPVDSFDVDGEMYYYYSMTPSVTVTSSDTVYVDPVAIQDQWYLLSAVDSSGLESFFSIARTTIVDPPNERVLVLVGPPSSFHKYSAVSNFYDSVMTLAGAEYDLMSLGTVTSVTPELLYPYGMVIVDDNLTDVSFARTYDEVNNYLIYSLLRRKLAYFGGFNRSIVDPYTVPADRQIPNYIASMMFNVDSVYNYGFAYCDGVTPTCSADSLKFAAAPAQDSLFPTVTTDTLRSVFSSLVSIYWAKDSPPSVATFHVGPNSDVLVDTLYTFHGIAPGVAAQEGELLGLRSRFQNTSAYLFGFHLWYMDVVEAASLVRAIVDSSSGYEYCCRGIAGNVNDDYADLLDITDLTYLVCYMFKDCDQPRCYDEANITTISDNLIDIVDLTHLVSYMFKGGPQPQACPAWPPLIKSP